MGLDKGGTHWLMEPEPARVYVIRDLPDLLKLIKLYPHFDAERHRMHLRMLDLGGQPPSIDFEAAAQDLDAIHLTREGQWRTRLSHPVSLYGWDCESTLWLRWKFTGARRVPTGRAPPT